MEKNLTKKYKILSMVGMFLFFLPPFIIFFWQTYVGLSSPDIYTKTERFKIMLNYLPDFLRHDKGLRAIFFFICSFLSVLIGYFGAKPKGKLLNVLRIVIIILGLLMSLLCLLAIKKSYLTG